MVVRCFGLCASTAGGAGSGPSQGTKITAPQLGRRRFKQGYVANSHMRHKKRICYLKLKDKLSRGKGRKTVDMSVLRAPSQVQSLLSVGRPGQPGVLTSAPLSSSEAPSLRHPSKSQT